MYMIVCMCLGQVMEGLSTLCEYLEKQLPLGSIQLNSRVKHIDYNNCEKTRYGECTFIPNRISCSTLHALL